MWNLTSKIETDSYIESRLTALGEWFGDGMIKQKRKRTHGHGQQCDNCGGGEGVGGDVRG